MTVKPLLGVIGGMGTQATAYFYEKLHNLQSVSAEQEYMDVLLYSMPSIPDRTAYITGQSTDSPLESLIHAARTLETGGASHIAVTCVTAHFFHDSLSEAVDVPMLNMLVETARHIVERGVNKVCLLATDGTLKSRVFHSALEKLGIRVVIPPTDAQSDLMTVIYNVKLGSAEGHEVLDSIITKSLKTRAEAVILGCTELCSIARESPDVINTLEILAKASLTAV